jgi:Lon protease-like protein
MSTDSGNLDMYELPLFPLNTVLFPSTPISLHIFEPRYKLMIERCLQGGQPFGVVLIREGDEALGPLAEPHPIGCTAQITQVENLEDGGMNIVAIGIERFQITGLAHDKPYLVGKVEPFPLHREDPPSLTQAGQRLRPWVERYLSILTQASGNTDFDLSRLPDDPVALAYLAAAVVQIPLNQKQDLLATNRAATFLADVRAIYRREVALLRAIVEHDADEEPAQRLFSLN